MRSSIVSTIQECYCGWVSLELLLTWFKKYHLLFPNYTSAFISSFNCLHQRDHNVISAAETLPSECVTCKTCQILQKHRETARVLLQTPRANSMAPTESINFISLRRDSFTDERYNFSQVAMFTFFRTR